MWSLPPTDIDDLFEVNSELLPVASRWNNMGLALKLKPYVLNTIEKNHTDVESRLLDVLTEWLNKAYNTTRFGDPSWKLLVEAVGATTVLSQKLSLKNMMVCKCLYDTCVHVLTSIVVPAPSPVVGYSSHSLPPYCLYNMHSCTCLVYVRHLYSQLPPQ